MAKRKVSESCPQLVYSHLPSPQIKKRSKSQASILCVKFWSPVLCGGRISSEYITFWSTPTHQVSSSWRGTRNTVSWTIHCHEHIVCVMNYTLRRLVLLVYSLYICRKNSLYFERLDEWICFLISKLIKFDWRMKKLSVFFPFWVLKQRSRLYEILHKSPRQTFYLFTYAAFAYANKTIARWCIRYLTD